MGFISIIADPASIKAIDDSLAGIPGAANKALADSINAAARAGSKAIKQSFLDNLALDDAVAKPVVNRRVTLRGGMAKPENLSARITISGKPIGLISFKTSFRQRGGDGVSVEIFKGRVIRLRNAFIGIGPRGKKHVMEATGPRVKLTTVHYRRNLNRTANDPRTVRGTNLPEIVAENDSLMQKPFEKIYEVLASSTAKNITKYLKRKT